MVKKEKTYSVLEVEDLEHAVSEYFGKEIKISEMDVTVYDRICPWEYNLEKYYDPKTEAIVMCVDVEGAENEDGDNWVGEDGLGLTEFFREKELFVEDEYIFAFDTSMFKSYTREVSTDD